MPAANDPVMFPRMIGQLWQRFRGSKEPAQNVDDDDSPTAMGYCRHESGPSEIRLYCQTHGLRLLQVARDLQPGSTEQLSEIMDRVMSGDQVDCMIFHRYADLNSNPEHWRECETDCLQGDAQMVILDREPPYSLAGGLLDWGIQARRWARQHSPDELQPVEPGPMQVAGVQLEVPRGFARLAGAGDALYLIRKGLHREVATLRVAERGHPPADADFFQAYLQGINAETVERNELTGDGARRLLLTANQVRFHELWYPGAFIQGASSSGLSERRRRQADRLIDSMIESVRTRA